MPWSEKCRLGSLERGFGDVESERVLIPFL